jgi:hypothetical protein
MRRDRIFHVVAATWLAALASCDTTAPPPADAADTAGTISFPLVTETGGHRYRLRNAALSISGPQFLQLFSTDDPAETALSAPLATGNYFAILFSWSLEQDDGTGAFRPVPATLVSGPVASFTVFNGATTTIGYRFQTDGVVVTVGAGQLRVTIAVDEIAPVCMPFADDDGCGAGAWCPPTGLTSMPRACLAAGSVALGDPCVGPIDCVAYAACIDAGAGPVCTALCPSSALGSPCATGGTCQPAAADDHGICTP